MDSVATGGAEGTLRDAIRINEGQVRSHLDELVRSSVEEALSYMAFPREHWSRIRTNNVLERIMREIRRRTRVVGNFPDGHSAVMLVTARLRHIAGTRWGTRKYLDTDRLREYAETAEETMLA